MKVKLKDKGGIFHDASQDATVTGTSVIELKSNKKVQKAIKDGVLVEVTGKDPKKDTNIGGGSEPTKQDYTKLKKAELQEELLKRGIEFDEDDTNKVLQGLLVADDKKKAGEAE